MIHLWEIIQKWRAFSESQSTQTEAMWREKATITFDVITDLDPDLFVEWSRFSLWYFSGRVKMAYSTAHHALGRCTGGAFLSKCSAYWWIEIHVSQFRYDNSRYLAFNSHLSLLHNLPSPLSLHLFPPPHFHSHSIITHLFFTPCVISLYPPTYLPTHSSTLISSYSPFSPHSPPFLHLSVCAQRETVGTSSSRILISHFVV